MKKLTFLILFISLFSFKAQAQFGSGNHPPEIDSDNIITFKKTETIDLKLWIFNPEIMTGNNSAIVFFFGGGWIGGSPRQFIEQAKFFSSKGMVSIIADYRVFSRDSVRAIKCISDAKSAIRWVRKNAKSLGIDSNKIVASGGSAGGHLAASTGTVPNYDEKNEDQSISSKPNAMVLFNPGLMTYASQDLYRDEAMIDRARIRVGDDPKKASPYYHLNNNVAPTIIFHGKNDKTVPYESVVLFDKKMKEYGNICELHLYEGEEHGFFNYGRNSGIAFKDTMEKSYSFLKKLKFIK